MNLELRRAVRLAVLIPLSAALLSGCGNGADTAVGGASTTTASTAKSVNGVYRVEITDADLVANGVTVQGDLLENHGLYTWKLMDGSWHFDARAEPAQRNPSDEGTYRIDHDRITFMFPAGDPPNLDLRYSLDGATLTFSAVGEAEKITKTLFTAKPWTKIG
jgi:hypothetical protein